MRRRRDGRPARRPRAAKRSGWRERIAARLAASDFWRSRSGYGVPSWWAGASAGGLGIAVGALCVSGDPAEPGERSFALLMAALGLLFTAGVIWLYRATRR